MPVTVEIPAVCPLCGGGTCLEWDSGHVGLSRLHCRPQHAGPGFCTFSQDLNLEPSDDGYVIVSRYRD